MRTHDNDLKKTACDSTNTTTVATQFDCGGCTAEVYNDLLKANILLKYKLDENNFTWKYAMRSSIYIHLLEFVL